MFKRTTVFHIAFQLFWVLPLGLCYGQTKGLDASLATPVHDYALTADSFVEGILKLADQFQIPTGIEWISCPATQARLAISMANGTVEEMLQAAVATQPGYRMRISNGVVHVIATTIPPNQNFLLLKVRSFEVHQELVEMAQQQLRNVVQATVVPPKPGGGGVAGSLISNVGEPRIDVHVTDATVEDVMDALAVTSVKKVWVVTFTESPAITATGFRRTATLRNSSPVPDDQQPVWETFRWDEPTG